MPDRLPERPAPLLPEDEAEAGLAPASWWRRALLLAREQVRAQREQAVTAGNALRLLTHGSWPEPIDPASVRRVAIYRSGGIADMALAWPTLRFLGTTLAHAEKILITHRSESARGLGSQLVEGTGLVDRVIVRARPNDPPDVRAGFYRRIRQLRIDTAIWLDGHQDPLRQMADLWLFLQAGVEPDRVLGLPWRTKPKPVGYKQVEPLMADIASRVARLGPVDLRRGAAHDFLLTAEENALVDQILGRASDTWVPGTKFAAMSLRTRYPFDDWGETRWGQVLKTVGRSDIGLVFVGPEDDAERVERVAKLWRGPTLNLCGQLHARQMAVVLQRAAFFMGHEGGPLQLAALQGVPTAAVFSARVPHGLLAPVGPQHVLFEAKLKGPRGIHAIDPADVAHVVKGLVAQHFPAPSIFALVG